MMTLTLVRTNYGVDGNIAAAARRFQRPGGIAKWD